MDLSCRYLGLDLTSPLVASASPLCRTPDAARRLAEAGVGALVVPSLFEEQIRAESRRDAELAAGADNFAEASGFLPASLRPGTAPDGSTLDGDTSSRRHLETLRAVAASVDIPVIGSLNGVTVGGWVDYAAAMQDAGAAAIELNIYFPPESRGMTGQEIEQRHVDVLTRVKQAVTVPVAVKLSPFFSSITEMAVRLDRAGADGLVLFNRFMQPDIDVETMSVTLGMPLSSPAEARLPRAWIALLRDRIRASLAATTGVESGEDVATYLLAGADVVMTTSALLRHGPEYASVLIDGLSAWMRRKGFASVDDLRGILRVPAEPRLDQPAPGSGAGPTSSLDSAPGTRDTSVWTGRSAYLDGMRAAMRHYSAE